MPQQQITTYFPAVDDSPMTGAELADDSALDQIRATLLMGIAERCGQVPDLHPRLLGAINAVSRVLAEHYQPTPPTGVRDRIRAKISDAFYDTRHTGGTMETAADRAADEVIALLNLGRIQ